MPGSPWRGALGLLTVPKPTGDSLPAWVWITAAPRLLSFVPLSGDPHGSTLSTEAQVPVICMSVAPGMRGAAGTPSATPLPARDTTDMHWDQLPGAAQKRLLPAEVICCEGNLCWALVGTICKAKKRKNKRKPSTLGLLFFWKEKKKSRKGTTFSYSGDVRNYNYLVFTRMRKLRRGKLPFPEMGGQD